LIIEIGVELFEHAQALRKTINNNKIQCLFMKYPILLTAADELQAPQALGTRSVHTG
jgi:hypothetical protein